MPSFVPLSHPRFTRGHFCLIGAAVAWSSGGVIVKAALVEVHPFAIAFYRNLFAALAFSVFLRRSSWRGHRLLPFCVATYAATVFFYLWSVKVTTAANAILLQYTWPVIVCLISAVVLRERVPRANLVAVGLGMAGVAVVFMGRGGANDTLGIGLALTSSVSFAISSILVSRLGVLNTAYLVFMCNLGGALVILPWAWPHLAVAWPQLGAIAVMGWFQLGLGWYLFTRGVQAVNPQEAGIITLLEPILNPIWVAIVVHEIPNRWTFAGGALIVAALVLRYTVMAPEEQAKE